MSGLDLAAVISSRICHDLVSPVGAIVNGVDLIREIGSGPFQDELGMISQSAERASSLLQFYRVAFGAADDEAAEIGRQTLQDQASRMIVTPRILLEWQDLDGPALSRREARLLYQMLLCARSILGMRGIIRVSLGAHRTGPIAITLEGGGNGTGGPAMNPNLVEMFDRAGDTDVPPRLIEFPLAKRSAEEMGLELVAEATPTALTLRAVPLA